LVLSMWNLNDFVTKSVAIASNKEVAIHCWRGNEK
jgi:hypothetical protein